MIFETDTEKNVKQVGDIKNNNVSIDASNINFIVTILSTGLYSKPIESFIRETVSNAWDSHIEAGVDEPVILELGIDTEGNKFCRIQDFGVGLSPERFNNVYKNIGSSTKRNDNTQIGGFGIGRFSALAYSEVVHITSVYGGKKYLYIMYKDVNTISIDLLDERDTKDRNGLEVKLPIKFGDFDNFAKAIKSQLVYFENLYIIDTIGDVSSEYGVSVAIQREYNNFSIKKYNNFWVNSLDGTKELNLVLGKVRYPVRIYNLDKSYSNKISNYPISLRFDIGDLEVTPNREEILYSSTNKKVIEEKLDLALLEINDLVAAEENKNFTKFSEYKEALEDTQYLNLIENDIDTDRVRIKLSDTKRNLTLNGVSFDGANFLSMYKVIMNYTPIVAQYKFQNNQIKYSNFRLSINRIKEKFKQIYFADVGEIKNISKRYIRETFEDASFFVKNDKPVNFYIKKYMRYVKETSAENVRMHALGYNRDKFVYDHNAFKVITKHILGNMSKIQTFNDSKVPLKWIADTKASDKIRRGSIKKQGFDWKQNINVHTIEMKNYGGVITRSTPHVMKDLSTKFKSLCIYGEKDSSKLRALYLYLKPGVRPKMVELATTKVKLLKEVENFVKIEDFMSTDYALIRNIATVEFLRREIPFLKGVARIRNLEEISPRLATVIDELDNFVDKYESAASRFAASEEERKLIDEIYAISEEKNYFNESIRGLFIKHKKELMNSKIFITLADDGRYIPDNMVNLAVDYVLVRKLIRPSVKAVYKLKKETIFNKEEKNEDN